MSEASDTLAARSFRDLLDEVAERRPAPGGGCATAWTGALAAALVQMSASFPPAGGDAAEERLAEIRARARELRVRALALGEVELKSYGPVLEALALPADDEERVRRLRRALSDAAEPPLAIAAAAAEVATLAAEAREHCSTHLRGDLTAGALLGEAACRAAARLVELNLADARGDGRLERAERLTADAAAARREILR